MGFYHLFIYFWLCWVFVAAQGFSGCSDQGLLFSCRARASHCGGLSYCGARALGCRGFSSCYSRALESRLRSCDGQAKLPCGMWNPRRPGIEPPPPSCTPPTHTGGWIPYHWITREVLSFVFLSNFWESISWIKCMTPSFCFNTALC